MKVLVNAGGTDAVDVAAVKVEDAGRAIEITVGSLNGRCRGEGVTRGIQEVVQIGEHPGWRYAVDLAETGDAAVEAGAVEVSVRAQGKAGTSAIRIREADQQSFHSRRRDHPDAAVEERSPVLGDAVKVAVPALSDCANGKIRVGHLAGKPVENGGGGDLSLAGNRHDGEQSENGGNAWGAAQCLEDVANRAHENLLRVEGRPAAFE